MHFARKSSKSLLDQSTPLILLLLGGMMVAAAWGAHLFGVMQDFIAWNTAITFQGVLAGLDLWMVMYTPLEGYRIELANGFTARIASSCSIVFVFGAYLLALSLIARSYPFALFAGLFAWGILSLLNLIRIVLVLIATAWDASWFEVAHMGGTLLSFIAVVGVFYLTLRAWRCEHGVMRGHCLRY